MKKTILIIFALFFGVNIYTQQIYHTYTVTGTETWDLTTYPDGVDIYEHLTIEPGGMLYINDITVRFKRDGGTYYSVEVKAGGKLVANNASFINYNYAPWKGILVRGDTEYPFYDLTQQGLLLLENCFIKGSYYAVKAENGYNNSHFGGGTVVIKGSTFQDNNTSICLSEAPLGLGSISGCTFLRTNDYPNYSWNVNQHGMPYAIRTINIKAHIYDCDFIATFDHPLTSSKPAVHVLGGDVRIFDCEFDNYGIGLSGQSVSPKDFLSVKDNYIKCRDEGVFLYNQTNSVLVQNEIQMTEVARSIFCWESTNFTIEENYIHTDGEWFNLARGIEVFRTGLYNNEIYNNTIENLWFGIYARENFDDDEHGLTNKCNKFINNRWDIFVYGGLEGEGIYKYQGSDADAPDAPAGNEFSYLGYAYSDFTNQSEEHVNYYYHNNSELNHEPIDYTGWSITTIANTGNSAGYDAELSCPSNFPTGGGVPYPFDTETRMANILNSIDAANQVSTLIAQLKDGGNTDEVISNINGSIPPEAYEIYLDLMQRSPYLSDEAIGAAINNENVLPNEMIRDIMVANPHAAKENELLVAIDERTTTMPDDMKAQIWEGLDLTSALEKLESIKAYYVQKSDKNHRLLMQYYMTDTIDATASKQALTALLEMGVKPEAYYQLAFMHLEDGNYTTGEQLLNTVPSAFDLNSFQSEELASLQEYYNLRSQMYQNGQFLGTISEDQLDALLVIAETGQGIGRGYARNILNMHGLWDYPDIDDDGLKNSLTDINWQLPAKAVEYERLKNVSTEHMYLTIAPNPATDYIIVQLTTKVLAENTYLQINSADGKLINKIPVTKNFGETIIDVSKLVPGVYTLVLINDNNLLDHNKFVIVK